MGGAQSTAAASGLLATSRPHGGGFDVSHDSWATLRVKGNDDTTPQIGFFYENDAHMEPPHQATAGHPATDGVFGRHVANNEFLTAWLSHGDWSSLLAVVANAGSAQSLQARFGAHPRGAASRRSLEIVPLQGFHDRFLATPPVDVLHLPQPVDTELAWVRHHKCPHGFALSGVTHTISLKEVMQRFADIVTAPFEEYDTLFCISRASLEVVRSATDNYADYLRERFGGEPRRRVRLEAVPFGVDTEKFKPATLEERLAARRLLGIPQDAVCVLYVGRLSYASKMHPFPLYRAVAEAARETGTQAHLVVAGWAESPSILQKFQQGAAALGPGLSTTFVDGMHPRARTAVWQAADIFTSLSDNIQETLGLTILEAQASGLPVVTTDWDGCRDSVLANETGYLVPTRMVAGATDDVTSRHLVGETSYGQFLGETNQSVAVDVPLSIAAFARLFRDAEERRALGARGRERVLSEYGWPKVIRRYGAVWAEQEAVRREHAALTAKASANKVRTPVIFPDVEHSFASYPSAILGEEALVVTAGDAAQRLELLLKLPLTSYVARSRISDQAPLTKLLELAAAPTSLARLEATLNAGSRPRARATLAWLLKYDLLRVC